eukprot:12844188-Alexandrium_andersonii.AAC.1
MTRERTQACGSHSVQCSLGPWAPATVSENRPLLHLFDLGLGVCCIGVGLEGLCGDGGRGHVGWGVLGFD